MTYQFAVSPDVHVRDLSEWFVLNTRVQKTTGESFHATTYDDFDELHRAIESGSVDLIFANAADTASLVRDHGFVPVARPAGVADEATVVVAADSPISSLDDLTRGLVVAQTDAPDVERICRILLEPSDLGADGIQLVKKRNYVLVAKALIAGEAQAGFFLRAAFDDLSDITRSQLRPLISSRIYVITHSMLASPAIAHLREPILRGLTEMSTRPSDQGLLAGLGAPEGWELLSPEDTEFLIDLMDTLAN